MSHKNNAFMFKCSQYPFIEDVICNSRIYSWKWIIKKIYICILVDSSCKTNSSFLTSRNVDTSVANNCFPTIWEVWKIFFEWGSKYCLLVACFTKFKSKNYIIFNSCWVNERLLLHIRNASSHYMLTFEFICLIHDWVEQRCLPRSNLAYNNKKALRT